MILLSLDKKVTLSKKSFVAIAFCYQNAIAQSLHRFCDGFDFGSLQSTGRFPFLILHLNCVSAFGCNKCGHLH